MSRRRAYLGFAVPARAVVVLLAAALLSAALPLTAAAATPDTLFVQSPTQGCSDSGPGSAAIPFCTVQAAANVVLPGQTVVIGPNLSNGEFAGFTVSRSGTPDQPIVFKGGLQIANTDITSPITLAGVHDVTVEDLSVQRTATVFTRPSIAIAGSSDVTVSQIFTPGTTAIDGASSDATVTRTGTKVSVAAGATGTVLTDDAIHAPLAIAGTTGTHVVNDSITPFACAPGVSVSASTGTVLANDVLEANCGTSPMLSVAADSTATTTTDYNGLQTDGNPVEYVWGDTTFASPATFAAATGQGVHDLAGNFVVLGDTSPAEHSALVDSADATAPDVPDVDINGNPRRDDPLVANTGTGSGFVDRGAFERQDPFSVQVQSATQAPVGGTVNVSVTASTPWGSITGYIVDFGDGTPPVHSTTLPVPHAYAATGFYDVETSVTDSAGNTSSPTLSTVTVVPPTPLAGHLAVASVENGLTVEVAVTATDSWNSTGVTVDFGDRTAAVNASPGEDVPHTYTHVGTYPVTATFHDSGGNTDTHSLMFGTPATRFTPTGPTRVLDTRIGTGTGGKVAKVSGTISVSIGPRAPQGVAAVAVTVVATGSTVGGFVTAWADGTPQPGVSTVNYAAKQTISNEAIVPVGADGKIALHVAGGATDLVADVTGYFSRDATAAGFTPLLPARLLDTRNGTGAAKGAVGASGMVVLTVAGRGTVPATGVTAVALNVTAADESAGGFVTAYPDGTARPTASSLNAVRETPVATMVVVPLGADGKVDLFNGSPGTTDLIADVVGYFSAGSATNYVPVTPYRAFDTRHTAAVAPRTVVTEPVSRPDGVANGIGNAQAAVLNTTVADTTNGGVGTMFGADDPQPTASSLNWVTGQVVANLTMPRVDGTQRVKFFNNSDGSTDVVGDVLGYYTTF